LARIAHALLPQPVKKIPIAFEICQNPFDLKLNLAFVSERHLVTDFRLNNVPGSTKIYDDWHCTHCHSFEDHGASKLAKRWEDKDIGRSHTLQRFAMD